MTYDPYKFDSMQGKLSVSERVDLYDTVVKTNRMSCLEIGTWKGGGSTYAIACGCKEAHGHLTTVESDWDFHFEAICRLQPEGLMPEFVKPVYGIAQEVVPGLQGAWWMEWDFVFFDGAEDSRQTEELYNLVYPKLANGAIVAFHDWDVYKCEDVRGRFDIKDRLCYNQATTGLAMFRTPNG